MNNREFALYKRTFVSSMRKILREKNSEILSEAAFPAYAHRNPLFSFPFWLRIRKICNYLEGSRFGLTLDYGCGGGVMLPFLAGISERVIAADIYLEPVQNVLSFVSMPKNIDLLDLQKKCMADIKTNSIDLIMALDVLEHVEDLEETLRGIARVIVPNGKIIISGPTETPTYKLGRKLAGHEFSGKYHTRCIYEIRDVLEKFVHIERVSTIYYPLPLFKLYYSVSKTPGK